MEGYIRDALHKMAVAIAHLWFLTVYLKTSEPPTSINLWVYAHHLGWGNDTKLLEGKRIAITISVEDWPSYAPAPPHNEG